MKLILQLLINVFPVILAAILHMFVVKKNWWNKLLFPLDHYKTFKGKRIFGDHKTYRGVFVMVLFSIFFTYLYEFILTKYSNLQIYNLLDFTKYSFYFYGVLFGLGYILGELPNSFYKRQKNVIPGKTNTIIMRLIDLSDSVIVILLLLVVFSNFTWFYFLIGVFFYSAIHLIINYLLFLIGWRKEPF